MLSKQPLIYKRLACFGHCQQWTEHVYCRSLHTTRYYDKAKKRYVTRGYDTYACRICEHEKSQEEMERIV